MNDMDKTLDDANIQMDQDVSLSTVTTFLGKYFFFFINFWSIVWNKCDLYWEFGLFIYLLRLMDKWHFIFIFYLIVDKQLLLLRMNERIQEHTENQVCKNPTKERGSN